MAAQKSILFLTNSELGQASVVLATAYEVAVRSDVDVHVGSFAPLKGRFDEVNALSGGRMTFHQAPGKSQRDTMAAKGVDYLPKHPPGVKGALQSFREAYAWVIAPFEWEDFSVHYQYFTDLITKLNPTLVVLEPLLGAAQDACVMLKRHYCVLSPNTMKDTTIHLQPGRAVLWHYPAMSTGFPYPLPWSKLFPNIYTVLMLVKTGLNAPRVVELEKKRNENGIPGRLKSKVNEINMNAQYFLPCLPELDLPVSVIPENFNCCGPIIPPFVSLDKQSELYTWLSKRPTILFNLGSQVKSAASEIHQVTQGLLKVLSQRADIQILWKCQRSYRTENVQGSAAAGALRNEGDASIPEALRSRLWITDWLEASPVAILEHPNVVMSVHHGGSNSYHEAVAAGVAQVVCPVWLDTYDFAARVETLGIGAYGNPTAAPSVESSEIAAAITGVLDALDKGPMSANIEKLRRRVLRQSSTLMIKTEETSFDIGRRIAAEGILRLI